MSVVLTTVTVGELQLLDLDNRIVATRDGVTVDGSLSDIVGHVYRFGSSPETTFRISLTITAAKDTKVELNSIPLDYQVLVMRELDDDTTDLMDHGMGLV